MRIDYELRKQRIAKLEEIFSGVSFTMLLRTYCLNTHGGFSYFMDMLSELYPAYRVLDVDTKEEIRDYLQYHYDIDIDYPCYEAIIWIGE